MRALLAILVLGVSASTTPCAALYEDQIRELIEFNAMFDVVHRNYDNQINRAWSRQKRNLNVLHAQFLSRYGFAVEDVKGKEAEVLAALEARGAEIGNSNSDCLNNTREALDNAVYYAGSNFAATVGEILYYFDEITSSTFYPVVEGLRFESNSIQWEFLTIIGQKNPVTDMNGLLKRMKDDYYVLLTMYEIVIETLDSEIRIFNSEFNQVRASVFSTLESISSYFKFTANLLIDGLSECAK